MSPFKRFPSACAFALLATALWAQSTPLSAAAWQLGPCGRGGLCPGSYTPLPTPTEAPTPDPGAPTPTPWPTPTASPTPIAGAFQLRVDVGSGSAFTDSQSQLWSADQAYVAGSYGYLAAPPAYASASSVDLTADPQLYQALRQGAALDYKVTVPESGSYRVTLHFAEFVAEGAGQRLLNVSLEGGELDSGLDVWAQAGLARAFTLSHDVTLSDGVLDLSVQAGAGKAMLAGIEVVGLQAQGVPTPTVTPTEPPLSIQLDLPANARLLSEP